MDRSLRRKHERLTKRSDYYILSSTMILTPQQLWKDYNRKEIPLGATTVNSGESTDCFFRTVYFNGEKVSDGITRIFAKLYVPKYALGKSAVIVFDDADRSVDAFDPAFYLKNGLSVLVVDYAGFADFKARFTIYPKSLATANLFSEEKILEDFETPAKESCWYVWTTVALRAVTFLETEDYQDLFFLGIGQGGEQVWKVCYFENTIRAGAIVFSGGAVKPIGVTDLSEEKNRGYLAYKAALDSSAYANFIKSPVFMQITSNEQNASLDRMNELYETAGEHGAYLSISERADRSIDPDRADNISRWFSAVLRGEKLPESPIVSAKGSQNKLYYEIKAFDPAHITGISFFVAHAQKNSAFRNWRIESMQMISEEEYLAKVEVLSATDPVFAFVNVQYDNGFCLSSAVEHIIPSSKNVLPETLTFKRLIYDSGMGLSDWLILNSSGGSNHKLSLQKGPFELEGITSPSHSLTTFRLADPQYKGRADSTLQLTLFSPTAQTVSFIVTASDRLSKYTYIKELAINKAWVKLTLSPGDFKGTRGSMINWQEVLTLEIKSAETVLVNSLLWV